VIAGLVRSPAALLDRSPVTAAILTPTHRRTLADTLPGARVRDAVLVVGFALLTALAAQISIPLGFTPVPITGQTFAVLLAGGALGAVRGMSSQFLYVALGAIGLPFYAEGDGGWTAATGSTAGYLVGFIVAAGVVGWMAERGQDRKVATAVPAFLVGSVIIYGLGATWLSHSIGVPLTAGIAADGSVEPSAIAYGVGPFLVGDVLKAVLAGLLLPAAWHVRTIVEDGRSQH
jgi:biotin transport system substrate-specific component